MRKILLALCLLPPLSALAEDFNVTEIVAAHNRWRELVGVAPLTYSTSLATSAQQWAKHLQQNNQCKMQHSKTEGVYGENLYWGSALLWSDGKRELQKVAASKVVDDWAGEKSDYNYSANRCTPGKMCGHYTQVVWRSTKAVGCAVAVCADSKEQVWVCQYQPAGNWVGEKPY